MPKINKSVADGRNAVMQAVVNSGYSNPDIWVACSGGADSLALMACAKHVSRHLGVNLHIVNVNHNLQEGSEEVSKKAAKVCGDYGIPVENIHIENVEVDITNGGLESAAREARYNAIENLAQKISGDNHVILTGHTMDDQAETVLLALSRGSGARSISGIPAQRGHILRPFLSIRRADTETICEVNNLDVWNDPTNYVTEDGPKRSVLRNTALPHLAEILGEGVIPGLARSADMARADDEYISNEAEAWVANNPVNTDGGYICDNMKYLPEAILSRVIKIITERETRSNDVNSKHVSVIKKYIIDYNGQKGFMLPNNVEVFRKNRLLFFKQH